MLKKTIALLMSAAILALSFASCSGGSAETYDPNNTNTDYKLSENVEDGTILHCFCWDFDTITNSLEDIAAAGYSSIQTSPINECLVGENGGKALLSDGMGRWYYHYQPTDYTIGNYQLGTRDEFKKMCKKADELGIKVIVDVVPNHTTPTTSAINKKLVNAVGGFDKLYHKGNSKDITNWGDRLQCTTYKMGGLPDINTENKDFQDYFIKYLNDCIECGADGFRYDAAKHIALPDDPTEAKGVKNNFWTRVTKEIKDAKRIFNYGEVLQGDNDRIGDYIDTIGACTASTYGGSIRSAVAQNFIDVSYVEDLRVSDRDHAVTWVESHDNYINDGSYNMLDNSQVTVAWAIIAARAKGTPLFFSRPYGADMDTPAGTINRIGVAGDPFYKSAEVSAVNFFRTAMQGEDEAFSNPDEDSTSLQICRGNKGAVIVTTCDKIKGGFETDLADGTYLDRVDNKTVYTVQGGKLTCDKPIGKFKVVVLYNDGYEQIAQPAAVKVSDKTSFVVKSEKDFKVMLESKNAAKATYQINDGKETEYKNGDTITVEYKDTVDGTISLRLRGESKAGQKTYMRYDFTNLLTTGVTTARIVEAGDKIYLKKPDGWGDTLYAYVYDGEGQDAKWPGLAMKKEGDKYSYTFKFDWENAYVIFSDGETQYPGENMQGLDVNKDEVYSIP